MKRLGVDVGGTFTDLIYVDDEAGVIRVHKLPTTPDDPRRGPSRASRELTAAAGESPAELDQVFHGTTIATNIVIEHNGAHGRDDHDRGLPRHPPHRAPQEAAQLLELPGSAVAALSRRAPPLPADRARADRRATARCSCRSTRRRRARRCGSSRRRASRRSPCASCSRSSTRSTSGASPRSCARSSPRRSSRSRPRCCRSTASTSASRPCA